MKRLMVIVFSLFALSLVACGSSDSPSDDVVGDEGGTADNGWPVDFGTSDGTQPDGLVTDIGEEDQGLEDQGQDDPGLEDQSQEDQSQEDQGQEDQGQEDQGQDDPGQDDAVSDTPDAVIECEIDEDCIYFGDPDVCHHFVCDVEAGKCIDVPVEDGTPCEDGFFCTGPDFCVEGACISGLADTCDDNDPCTDDYCNEDDDLCGHIPDETLLTCGTGECYREIPHCQAGEINECVPGEPTGETCDGLDNDCDGATDNGNPGGGVECETELAGPCIAGRTLCVEGHLVCEPLVLPELEICDGVDNDCDGEIDNGDPDGGRNCNTGEEGVCRVGETVCVNAFVVCQQTVFPSAELCDGLDNDCNGAVDEGNPEAGQNCPTGLPGVCGTGKTSCVNGELFCNQTVEPSAEICDGKDNSCDGITDPPNSLSCLNYTKDADDDGYGVTGDVRCLCAPAAPYTATQGGDCCDDDAQARPGVSTFRTQANACGNFDYNCDGATTQHYEYGTGRCETICLATVEGWIGQEPDCGEQGTILRKCSVGWFECNQDTEVVTQGCF